MASTPNVFDTAISVMSLAARPAPLAAAAILSRIFASLSAALEGSFMLIPQIRYVRQRSKRGLTAPMFFGWIRRLD